MKIISKISDIRKELESAKSIGFVPTMGALHEGHISLVNKAKSENDICVVSIFVNPTQFGPNEDYDNYPRTFEMDTELLIDKRVDILFYPDVTEMYPDGFETYVNLENLPDHLCGKSREGHFKGVCTIVSKFFNIVKPNRAYFGQKDYQQALIIKKMVRDLNMDVDIVIMPIIRESDGLAKSSRNKYLSERERKDAVVLNKSLELAEELIESGERRTKKIISHMEEFISDTVPGAKIDYISVVNPNTLEDIDIIESSVVVAMALIIGDTRLIDNKIIVV